MLEQIPRIVAISRSAMLGNMDAHRREVRGIEDIIDICRPIFVADTRRPVATDVDILEVRTLLEGPFQRLSENYSVANILNI